MAMAPFSLVHCSHKCAAASVFCFSRLTLLSLITSWGSHPVVPLFRLLEEQTGSHTPHNMTTKKANVKVSECENAAIFACIDKYVRDAA